MAPRPGAPAEPGSARAIRVAVADDQALVRLGGSCWNRRTTWSWWARPRTAGRRSRWSAKPRPDVVLMDVRMPVMDGLAAPPHRA